MLQQIGKLAQKRVAEKRHGADQAQGRINGLIEKIRVGVSKRFCFIVEKRRRQKSRVNEEPAIHVLVKKSIRTGVSSTAKYRDRTSKRIRQRKNTKAPITYSAIGTSTAPIWNFFRYLMFDDDIIDTALGHRSQRDRCE